MTQIDADFELVGRVPVRSGVIECDGGGIAFRCSKDDVNEPRMNTHQHK
jgi:hypothetical protein